MKKIGGFILALGVILMLVVGYNFITDKTVAGLKPAQPAERADRPFPWYPSIAAILVASGIIIIATSGKRRRLNP